MSSRVRAEPRAPDDRRRAILEAVTPLILEKGGSVTTAQMAQAACIAEGTIFRVFPDKPTLIFEAIKASFDPQPVIDRLATIERALPLDIKLRKAAAIILERSLRVHALVAVLRSMPSFDHSIHEDAHRNAIAANSLILRELTKMFAETEGLAVEPARAAAAFRGLLFAVSFPLNDPDEQLTADEAIEILLRGVSRRPD
jgi:AcrR family transcriptional regulator